MMKVLLLCPSALPCTLAVAFICFNMASVHFCVDLFKLSATVTTIRSKKRNIYASPNDEIKAWGLSFTASGKMSSIHLCFVAEQTSSLRCAIALLTHCSCYLWRRRGSSPLRMKGKTPSERKQWSLWRHAPCLEDGKASDLPHPGYYGYGRERINVL